VVIGKSESHKHISTLVSRLEESSLFDNPDLKNISGEGARNFLNDFQLSFQVKPYSELSEGEL
jgi:hypothetical protein